jgi:DNA repair protein RecO
MKHIITLGIILSRTEYGEADRIITVLTPEQGKLRLIARGVRKIKSRAAGGIELFSVSELTYMQGRGALGTLVSAHLKDHYGDIVKDIDRVQLGYNLIKMLNKATEDELEAEYFNLLEEGFRALNELDIPLRLVRLWFESQLLRLSGHEPNLQTDTNGKHLKIDSIYEFDFDAVSFRDYSRGRFSAEHIKVLRLLFSGTDIQVLNRIEDFEPLLEFVEPIVSVLFSTYTRV